MRFGVLLLLLVGTLVLIWALLVFSPASVGRGWDAACYQEGELVTTCPSPESPYVLFTSDIHLSNEVGRWPWTTDRFDSLLEQTADAPPQVLFVNGDLIDNFDGQSTGDWGYWQAEFDLYEDARNRYSGTQFQQAYGTGHDWLNDEQLEELESRFGAARGSFRWRGFNIIWLTINLGSFLHTDLEYEDVMEVEDYEWLRAQLAESRRNIVAFHVPILTKETSTLWAEGRNLAIDPRDSIYKILDANLNNISVIFNGHLHDAMISNYQGVPLYVCPFFDRGAFCTLEDYQGEALVARYHLLP
jgi:UDP-2,3-diacylglucosamine pyrophosphatase LpxH